MRPLRLILFAALIFFAGCRSEQPPTEPIPQGWDAPMDVDVVDPDDIPPAPVISAEEAIEDFEIEDGFEIQLVAREPEVVDPVALTFDEDGAMWIVEMRDYMWTTEGDKTGDPAGRIVILRDTDGDGFNETSTVFMDGLFLPRAISIYNGGVLVAVPPNLLFVERTGEGGYEPGDITVVDSVYAVGMNAEHQPNGLIVAMDNWIYNAKSDQRYRYQNGAWLKESTETRGQWGISQDDWGRLFYNGNSTTLIADDFPPNLISTNPHRDVGDRRVYGVSRASNRTWPRRVTPGVNRGYAPVTLGDDGKLVNVTSAAGPVIYRGDNFPESFYGNAFVSETSANLVKRVVVEDIEGVVEGRLPYENREFWTSTDERFRPVNGYTAPDGSLYILDMYRGVIQHVTYLTDYLKKQIEMRGLDTPIGLGRIYRVKWQANDLGPTPRLSEATNQQLVMHLSHENGWWRDTAQRLLVERNATEMRTALEVLAVGAEDPRTRIHALWALEGIDQLTFSTLELASENRHPKVQGAISRLAAQMGGSRARQLLVSMLNGSNREEARHVAAAAAILDRDAWPILVASEKEHPDFPELIDIVLGGIEDREEEFLIVAEAENASERLLGAANHAAGMALVQSLSGVRLLPASFSDSFERGEAVYSQFCSTCHGREGEGMAATAPPLLRSQWVLQDPDRLIRLTLDGIEGPVEVDGKLYQSPDVVDHMPGLRDMPFSDQEIADALTFVRNSWENQATGISEEQVARVRSSSQPRTYSAQTLIDSETGWTPLLSGNDTAGWTVLNGNATYQVENGVVTGTTALNTPNTFLTSDKHYSDFILEYEFLVDPEINSGVQIRSNSLPEYNNGRVHGYQIEIDPSERAWTAGIYDESRRGWINDLQRNPKARNAFWQNEWNHVRVEARGDHLRTWLNGVLAADLLDSMTASGFIGLQVHGIGKNEDREGKTVQWRTIRIKELD